MLIKNIINIFFLFYCSFIFSQKDNVKVTAIDKKNLYKKHLFLAPKFDLKYYNQSNKLDSTSIKNNKFEFNIQGFSDDFPRPYFFIMEFEKNKSYLITQDFYILNKSKNVVFDSENAKITDENEYNELKKDKNSYIEYMKDVFLQKGKIDSIKYTSTDFEKIGDSLKPTYEKLKEEEEKRLLKYSKLNPNSIILFWEIVNKTENEGYNLVYETAFTNLSKRIKNSSPGKELSKLFTQIKKITIGNYFNFYIKNSKIKISKKYTLVDFWFSYCKPCIEEMPKYKLIYEKYKVKGFEYIGISTDRSQDINNWKKVIEKNGLVWQNLLDENGLESKKYNINKFPTTFLLDSEGKIVKKDISPEELDKFLEENLKN